MICALLASGASLAAQAPVWQRDLDTALNLARDARRPVLVLATAGAWCDPCGWLDQNTLSDASVLQIVNRSFVPLRVEDTEPGFARLGVTRLPTLLVLAADGSEIGRFAGPVGAAGLAGSLTELAARATGTRSARTEAEATAAELAQPAATETAESVVYRLGTGTITWDGGTWTSEGTILPETLEEYDRDTAFVYLRDPDEGVLWAITVAEGEPPRLWQWDAASRSWRERARLELQ